MNVTAVIVHYQTPGLLKDAVESFKKFYPGVNILLFDNGSRDNSLDTITELKNRYNDTIQIHFNPDNIFHGPAMDYALKHLLDSQYVFFLDSDTVTTSTGFLEESIQLFRFHSQLYATGHLIHVNRRGFKDPDGFPVILTPYFMLKRETYLELPPFIHHGQPTIHNFREAAQKNLQLKHFPYYDYIDHLWRGTASRYGYKLGLKGKLDYFLNRLGF